MEHLVLEEFVEIVDTLFTGLEDQLGLVRIGNLVLRPGGIIEKTIDSLATAEKGDLREKTEQEINVSLRS